MKHLLKISIAVFLSLTIYTVSADSNRSQLEWFFGQNDYWGKIYESYISYGKDTINVLESNKVDYDKKLCSGREKTKCYVRIATRKSREHVYFVKNLKGSDLILQNKHDAFDFCLKLVRSNGDAYTRGGEAKMVIINDTGNHDGIVAVHYKPGFTEPTYDYFCPNPMGWIPSSYSGDSVDTNDPEDSCGL